MKIKLNHFERVAGIFLLVAVVGSLAAMLGVAVKKGWFESKVVFETSLKTAEGVHPGTNVQMAGLRAGSVVAVDLKSDQEIRVRFEVSEKFHVRIRKDSVVRVTRPFIIGDKVLELTVGTNEAPMLQEGGLLVAESTVDIMDLMSGRTIGPYLESLGKLADNLKFVAEAFLDKDRAKSIVKMFDEIHPLLIGVRSLTKEANHLLKGINKKDALINIVGNLLAVTNELNKYMPQIANNAPDLAQDLTKIAHNTAALTDELQKIIPMMADVGPELPRASRRALEALDETVVTLKALQKSFILRGNVREVREEEEKRTRKPASESNSTQNETEKESSEKP